MGVEYPWHPRFSLSRQADEAEIKNLGRENVKHRKIEGICCGRLFITFLVFSLNLKNKTPYREIAVNALINMPL
jgi:hypothetical protein